MVEFRVLGGVDMTGASDEDAHSVLRQPKRLALLAYLAIESRRHFARRDSLLATFWPELDDKHGRHALRQALHALRRALGNDAIRRRGDDDLALNSEAISCDAAAFEEALDHGQSAAALALYAGDLLPGVFVSDAPAFDRWLDDTRERLRQRAVVAARSLEQAADTANDFAAAAQWVRRALALAPHDESALRRLLGYLNRVGDRAGALNAYDAFAQRLGEDLELSPSPETRALVDAVRTRDQLAAPASTSATSRPTPGAIRPAPPTGPVKPVALVRAPAPRVLVLASLVVAAAVGILSWRANGEPVLASGVTVAPTVAPLRATIARRFYDEGMSAWSRGDPKAAEQLTLAAFRQDSTFALALFTYGHLIGQRAQFDSGLRAQRRAVAMAPHQPDHDRLLILTWFGQLFSNPLFPLYAETLAIRYPDDLQALWFVAQGRRYAGDFPGSIAPLRRIIDIDRRSLRGTSRARCFACIAFPDLISSYENVDSLTRAETTAREWIRESPRNADAWGQLVYQLSLQGRYTEAMTAQQRREDLGDDGVDIGARGEILLRAGDLDTYERILLERLRQSSQREANDLRWKYWTLLRYQGRMREALAQAPLMRGEAADEALKGLQLIMRAQSFDETGQFRAAARLWDSMATNINPREPPAQAARIRAWIRVRMADALRPLGDTSALRRLADTIRADGVRSGLGRDRLLHHHALGLLSEARGEVNAACSHYRQALFGATPTYPRTNIAIGRTCIAARRPLDAAKPLYGALHGPIGASGTYATMTEVHELLGALHEALGRGDSARYWYGRAADAWKQADPEWLARPERQPGALRTASSARPAAPGRRD